MPGRNEIRLSFPKLVARASHARAHSAPVRPLRAPSAAVTGGFVEWDLHPISMSTTLMTAIHFIEVLPWIHAWHWRSTLRATFRTSADSWMLTVCSFLASILARQANVKGVSTATKYSGGQQGICEVVIMRT